MLINLFWLGFKGLVILKINWLAGVFWFLVVKILEEIDIIINWLIVLFWFMFMIRRVLKFGLGFVFWRFDLIIIGFWKYFLCIILLFVFIICIINGMKFLFGELVNVKILYIMLSCKNLL